MHTRFTDNREGRHLHWAGVACGGGHQDHATGWTQNTFGWAVVWSITPTLATVIMLLVVTREGYLQGRLEVFGPTPAWASAVVGSRSSGRC